MNHLPSWKKIGVTCNQKEKFKRGPFLKRPVHWKNGFRTLKPASIIQGIFLAEIDSGRARCNFDIKSWNLSRIHTRRNSAASPKNKKCKPKAKGDNVLKLARLSKLTSKTTSSPHFVLNTTPNSGSDIGIIDTRFYWQLSGKKSSSVAFAELEPCGTESDFRILFSIRTGTPGKFCTDYDGFYPPSHPPSEKGLLPLWHPALALIPKEGNGVRIFNMDNGLKEAELFFASGIVLEDVTCHESKTITLRSKKTSLAKEVLSDFLVFEFPPLQLQAHVQLMASSIKDSNSKMKSGRVETGVVFEDFLVISYASNRMEFYDLEQLLFNNKLEEATDRGVTHKVTALPSPLLTLTSEHLSYPHHLLFVVEVKQGLQIQNLTANGLIPVLLEDGMVNSFPSDSKICFMKTAPVQIILNHEAAIKVFRVCQIREKPLKNETESYLKLIFEKSFLQEDPEEQRNTEISAGDQPTSSSAPKRQHRNIPRKSYAGDIALAVEFDENTFLNQVAFVRFAENSVSCFVYDSLTLELVYQINVDHFRPKPTEVYDFISVHFSNQFIVVKRKGSSNTSLYVFNLVADCEQSVRACS